MTGSYSVLKRKAGWLCSMCWLRCLGQIAVASEKVLSVKVAVHSLMPCGWIDQWPF